MALVSKPTKVTNMLRELEVNDSISVSSLVQKLYLVKEDDVDFFLVRCFDVYYHTAKKVLAEEGYSFVRKRGEIIRTN